MTDAELAVLGLVVECPRHAYEIEQVIVERGMRDWTDVGFSSIYYLLRKMEQAGLVEGRRDSAASKGPARTIYSATSAGFTAWTEASLSALANPDAKMPFLLGLAGLGGLPEDRALEAARNCLQSLEDRLQNVAEKHRNLGEVEWFVEEVFDYSEQSLRFGRDWVAEFVKRLERRSGAKKMPKKMKPFTPEIAEMPDQLMAVVHTVGDPTIVGDRVFPALYGAAYGLKFALKKDKVEYKVEPSRSRWFGGPDWATQPRETWKAAWAIPIPDGTTELKQKDPDTPVTIETWEYGTVAQILHVGTYAEETPTIQQLHEFIESEGYEITGPHEEEYHSRPGPKAKTVIRYQIRKREP
ncbi:MAG: GyrI-like domain-containing protein [Coriobacteriia bacterium]